MELQHSAGHQTHQNSLVEWAVGRKEKSKGPHKALLPVVKPSPSGLAAGLIDAIGPFEPAMEVAKTAASVIEEYTHQSLIDLFARAENRCGGTDGVSMSAFLVTRGFVNWYGVGCVQGTLFRRNAAAEPRITYLERSPEVLGTGRCTLKEFRLPMKPGDLIILSTVGVADEFVEALPIDGKPRVVADQLLANYCKEDMDCAIIVVRYLG